MDFICMSKDFRDGSVEFHNLDAEDEQDAWEYIEEAIASNMTQEWVFSEKDWKAFLTGLKEFKEE